MNLPESNPTPNPAADSPERRAIIELRKSHASMRMMFHLLALCALMLTATIFVLFFKQLSATRRQVDESVAYIQEYNKLVPQIDIVRGNLASFARTNDALNLVLRKYFPTNAPRATAPAAKSP